MYELLCILKLTIQLCIIVLSRLIRFFQSQYIFITYFLIHDMSTTAPHTHDPSYVASMQTSVNWSLHVIVPHIWNVNITDDIIIIICTQTLSAHAH